MWLTVWLFLSSMKWNSDRDGRSVFERVFSEKISRIWWPISKLSQWEEWVIVIVNKNICTLIFARHFSKCFMYINSFNPHNSSLRQVLLLLLFYRWSHGQRHNLPIVMRLRSRRTSTMNMSCLMLMNMLLTTMLAMLLPTGEWLCDSSLGVHDNSLLLAQYFYLYSLRFVQEHEFHHSSI